MVAMSIHGIVMVKDTQTLLVPASGITCLKLVEGTNVRFLYQLRHWFTTRPISEYKGIKELRLLSLFTAAAQSRQSKMEVSLLSTEVGQTIQTSIKETNGDAKMIPLR